MARSSRTPFVVLGLLGLSEPEGLSGYEIKKAIDTSVAHFWSESFGQIYPVLKRLDAEKFIQQRTVAKGGRRKAVYSITAKGKRCLGEWLEHAPEPSKPRDELVLKIFLGSNSHPSVLIRHLEAHRSQVEVANRQYTAWLKEAEQAKKHYTPFQVMTLRGGIIFGAAFLKWADESLGVLKRLDAGKGMSR